MLLSLLSVGGSAAAAGAAVEKLRLPLLVLSVVFLAYAHYRVWTRSEADRTGKVVLVANTLLAVVMWTSKIPL